MSQVKRVFHMHHHYFHSHAPSEDCKGMAAAVGQSMEVAPEEKHEHILPASTIDREAAEGPKKDVVEESKGSKKGKDKPAEKLTEDGKDTKKGADRQAKGEAGDSGKDPKGLNQDSKKTEPAQPKKVQLIPYPGTEEEAKPIEIAFIPPKKVKADSETENLSVDLSSKKQEPESDSEVQKKGREQELGASEIKKKKRKSKKNKKKNQEIEIDSLKNSVADSGAPEQKEGEAANQRPEDIETKSIEAVDGSEAPDEHFDEAMSLLKEAERGVKRMQTTQSEHNFVRSDVAKETNSPTNLKELLESKDCNAFEENNARRDSKDLRESQDLTLSKNLDESKGQLKESQLAESQNLKDSKIIEDSKAVGKESELKESQDLKKSKGLEKTGELKESQDAKDPKAAKKKKKNPKDKEKEKEKNKDKELKPHLLFGQLRSDDDQEEEAPIILSIVEKPKGDNDSQVFSLEGKSRFIQTLPEGSDSETVAPPKQLSIFEKYGGDSTVHKIVSNMYQDHVLKDQSLCPFFKKSKIGRLEKQMSSFLARAMGSKFLYKGKSLVDAHKGMKITDDNFESFMRHLSSSLEIAGIDHKDAEEIRKYLLAYKGDVVGV